MPDLTLPSLVGGSTGFILLVVLGMIFIFGILGLFTYVMIQLKMFNITVKLWGENANKVPYLKAIFKGRIERLGNAGDEWLKIKTKLGVKVLKIIPRPTKWVSNNEVWIIANEDGEWFDFCLESIHRKLKELKVSLTPEDMRANRLAIQKNLQLRRDGKPSFLAKYGGTIAFVVFFMIVIIAYIIILREQSQAIKDLQALPQVAESLKDIAIEIRNSRINPEASGMQVIHGLLFIPFLKKRKNAKKKK